MMDIFLFFTLPLLFFIGLAFLGVYLDRKAFKNYAFNRTLIEYPASVAPSKHYQGWAEDVLCKLKDGEVIYGWWDSSGIWYVLYQTDYNKLDTYSNPVVSWRYLSVEEKKKINRYWE